MARKLKLKCPICKKLVKVKKPSFLSAATAAA